MKLEDNYRSTGGILTVANRVMKGAGGVYGLNLKAARGRGVQPEHHAPLDVHSEAREVADRIRNLIAHGADAGDIAVLFRNASYARNLEGILAGRGIPYELRGGQKLMEAAHVRDYLAYLKVAERPDSELSLRRVLLMLPGVGKGTAAKGARWAAEDPGRLARLAEGPFRKSSLGAVARLGELFAAICPGGDAMGDRPRLALDYYGPMLEDLYRGTERARARDLETVAELAGAFPTLSAFLEALVLDPPDHVVEALEGGKVRKSRVTLSTVHSAKGLEWPHVFIISAVEGRIPFFLCQNDPDLLEEERRLMYVAVTRARDTLVVTSPRIVSTGYMEDSLVKPSRFIRIT
ncbi:MAG: ATP-dependent helicase [Deltaproteobacteria bacterium]|nr:ATP-dependent helicase [Deltaproteobacteria bacterium]